MAEPIATITDDAGTRRLILFANGDGRFSFEEEQKVVDRVPELGPLVYWRCTHQSGLYASQAEAERDARAMIPWLRKLPTD